MKLINLEQPKPKIVDDSVKQPTTIGSEDYYEKYPWGTVIDLNTEALDKLGIDISEYNAEDPVIIQAKGFIKRVESSTNSDSSNKVESRKSLSIQLTDLGVENSGNFEAAFKDAIDEG